ncbi:MAG TPA: Vms1/Ankzf1 family peptidyl-tRNA hydrolase [Ilumatobacteraceae bacterium]|nr:Vms1/Ankzf1 family peptidyl-tRNA hydrolase [Ilumatobacteraceae bacterium]HRB01800.1 Vms1/Ankzf1 family peptidyl-tRNA hydrolase [Ilumatobacteraceae bacterium]
MNPNDDLRALSTESDWYATMTIPAPSNLSDAQSRFEVEWHNARRQLSNEWTHEEIARLDEVIAGLHHHDAAAVVVVHARGGATFVELLEEPVSATTVHEGPLPRWATVLESRQRVVPHVVVETDRAGADLTGFVGSVVLASETVDGETLHIHRGAPGGWSQRRFQQRAENTWESNARDVADAVATMARDVRAELVAVAGDVRAQGFVLDSLPTDVAAVAVKIEAGSPGGIADEVVRLVASIPAAHVTATAELVRSRRAHGTAVVDAGEVAEALREGRVDTLLVHDDGSDGPGVEAEWCDGARLVDRAINAALATDATILVVPNLTVLEGPLAALLRW